MHSKDEPLFRVGSYYRDGDGDVFRLYTTEEVGVVRAAMVWHAGTNVPISNYQGSRHRLSNGKFIAAEHDESRLHLLPDECDAQGYPITPDSDGLSDALSEQAKHLKADHPDEMTFEELMADLLQPAMSDKDAAMVLRDGPAKAATVELRMCDRTGNTCRCNCGNGQCAMKSTAHPPIAGLMRENGFSHKLGSANLGKCA